jgi:phage terminase small subunit
MRDQRLNSRQESFCKLFLSCGIAAQAYREAGYQYTSKSAGACASKLLRLPAVQARLTQLRNATDARLNRKDIKKEALVERFWEIVHDPDTRCSDAIQAGISVAKLLGWNAPTRVEHDLGDRVRSYLEHIRAQPLRTLTTHTAQVVELEAHTAQDRP